MLLLNPFGLLSCTSAITATINEDSRSIFQSIRPEHIAFNVPVSVTQTKLLSDNLGMNVVQN